MYIYNVTTNVAGEIHDKWFQWMKAVHIPEMLNSGKFSKAIMTKVLIDEEMGGTTYSVQYTTDSLETLEKYYEEDAPKLRNEANSLFQDKIVAFRTELEVVSEQFSVAVKN